MKTRGNLLKINQFYFYQLTNCDSKRNMREKCDNKRCSVKAVCHCKVFVIIRRTKRRWTKILWFMVPKHGHLKKKVRK